MATTLVTNGKIAGALNGTTSSAIDTTGASLIVLSIGQYDVGSDVTLSDSKGNTWVKLTVQSNFDTRSWIAYCINPTVGTGHTFTIAGSNSYSFATISAWVGTAAATTFRSQNSANSAIANSIQPGSVTPDANGQLVWTGFCGFVNASSTINSSFTITDQNAGASGTCYGGAGAYLIQGTAAAVNPTWSTNDAANDSTANIAVFEVGPYSTPANASGADATYYNSFARNF